MIKTYNNTKTFPDDDEKTTCKYCHVSKSQDLCETGIYHVPNKIEFSRYDLKSADISTKALSKFLKRL